MGTIEYHHIEALDCRVQVIDNSPYLMRYIYKKNIYDTKV